MNFCAFNRVVCLLAVGLVWSGYVLNTSSAVAAAPLGGKSSKDSAPQTVSVEDVQRILAEERGKSDARVARRLSSLELIERMSSTKLKLLEQSVPGTQSRWALVALADASVFLDPAAADVLSQASPDLSEQQQMIALTMEYLGKTLPKLPDFYATRTTVRYKGDVQRVTRAWAKPENGSSWRIVSSSQAVVVYRDGKEVVDPREWREHPSRPEGEGLITRGTFGPILSTVIADAAHGEMTWERWERGSAGTLAVFRYRVPEDQSHYSVAFHGLSIGNGDAEQAAGYHGDIAIDPATGTILRLTVEAYPPLSSPILRGDIMVEYGAVEIGGKTYTCPIRSVSISINEMGLMGGVDPFGRHAPAPETILLNDVTFGGYRLFGSESRIVTGNIAAPQR